MWEKAAAAVLVLCGAQGFGYAVCQEMQCLQYHLIEQKQMLFYTIGEISYFNRPMAELLECISGRLHEPYDTFAGQLARRMELEGGKSMEQLWREETESLFAGRTYPSQAKEALMHMGECFGYEQGTQQIAALRQLCAQLEEEIGEIKDRRAEKGRLIQTLSLLAGVFCVVLFL